MTTSDIEAAIAALTPAEDRFLRRAWILQEDEGRPLAEIAAGDAEVGAAMVAALSERGLGQPWHDPQASLFFRFTTLGEQVASRLIGRPPRGAA